MEKAIRILQNIDGISHIELDEEDVVRHKLVKAIIKAYDKEKRKRERPPITGTSIQSIIKRGGELPPLYLAAATSYSIIAEHLLPDEC